MTDRELLELQQDVRRLKRFRSRLVELVPVGTFMAVVVAMVWMQFELGGRVSAVEARLGGIETRLGAVEAGMRQMQGTLVEISRTLGRLEGRPAAP